MNEPILTIVVPCYNEEEVLPVSVLRLRSVLNQACNDHLVSGKSTILLVDDGSKDLTWKIIENQVRTNREVTGLKLSRNFGHQNALIAGMETARVYSDCVITIDADLQDDVNVIPTFLEKYKEGFDIVYGVRDQRKTDTFFKRNTALLFYRLMGRMGVRMVPNHADFRLLSQRALDEFAHYQEENLFLRGIVPLLGFKSTKVYYNRAERFAGKSKYPFKKMINFALDGLTSFSIAPIRMVTYLGLSFVGVGGLTALYALIQHFMNHAVTGWTSLILSVWLIGGIQLTAIGVIGEYVGKIFKETKQRPRYTIEERKMNHSEEKLKNKAL
ncbi:MAG: glycosyltransferase family 2 protein [Sporolactobacillus sp.]